MTKTLALFLMLCWTGFGAGAEVLSAEAIMQRVIANQTRAEEARKRWVYEQEVFVRSQQRNKKPVREETRQYRILPDAASTKRELLSLQGFYLRKGKKVEYTEPPEDDDVDEFVSDFAEELTDPEDGEKSRDAAKMEYFPLSEKRAKHYRFALREDSEYRGKKVYVVGYQPVKGPDGEYEEPWEGEVLVDKEEFQPVFVSSFLSLKIPWAVRTFMGINLRNLGFKVEYEEFEKGVWFPVRGGGEFKLDVLFFLKRDVAYSWKCREFRRTETESKIVDP